MTSDDDLKTPGLKAAAAPRALLTVDLGELKARASAACAVKGMSMSDWVRAAVATQLDQPDSGDLGRAPPVSAGVDNARGYMELDAGLTTRLDALVEAGGFRSRVAALRALLEGSLAPAQPEAFGQAVARLGQSNHELSQLGSDFGRIARSIQEGGGPTNVAQRLALERATTAVFAHLESSAQVVALLRPLLKSQGE